MRNRTKQFIFGSFKGLLILVALQALVFAQNDPSLDDFAFVFEHTPVSGVVSRTLIQRLNERRNPEGRAEIEVQLFKFDRSTLSRSSEGQGRRWVSKESFDALKSAQAEYERQNERSLFRLNQKGELVFYHPYRDREEKVIESVGSPICLVPSNSDDLAKDSDEILEFALNQNQPTIEEASGKIEARLVADFKRIQALRLEERFNLNTSSGLISARNELWKKIHDWYEGDDEKALQLISALTLFGEFRGHWNPAHGFYFMKVMENRVDQNFLDYHKGLAKTPSLRLKSPSGEPIRLPIGENWLVDTAGPIMLDPNGIDAWDGVKHNDNLREILKMDLQVLNAKRLQEISKFTGEYSQGQWAYEGEYSNMSRLTAYDSPAALEAISGSRENKNMHILPALPSIRNRVTGEVSIVESDHFRGGEDDALRNVRRAQERKKR